ncbi:MAG: amidohydrolase, partial [Promethearchaeota archaeon]
ELLDHSHILFGSDFPFVHEIAIKEMIREIVNYNEVEKKKCLDIEQKNALSLFPHFKSII